MEGGFTCPFVLLFFNSVEELERKLLPGYIDIWVILGYIWKTIQSVEIFWGLIAWYFKNGEFYVNIIWDKFWRIVMAHLKDDPIGGSKAWKIKCNFEMFELLIFLNLSSFRIIIHNLWRFIF